MASSMVSQSLPGCDSFPSFSENTGHRRHHGQQTIVPDVVDDATTMIAPHGTEPCCFESNKTIDKITVVQINLRASRISTNNIVDNGDLEGNVDRNWGSGDSEERTASKIDAEELESVAGRTIDSFVPHFSSDDTALRDDPVPFPPSSINEERNNKYRYTESSSRYVQRHTAEDDGHFSSNVENAFRPSVFELSERISCAMNQSTSQPPYPEPQQKHRLAKLVGAPLPAPSWMEISLEILPAAAKELFTASLNRLYRSAQISYMQTKWAQQYSDYGNHTTGYFLQPKPTESTGLNAIQSINLDDLPHFSSLPWIERQMVKEWRTYYPNSNHHTSIPQFFHNQTNELSSNHRLCANEKDDDDDDDENDVDFDHARTLVPAPLSRPVWDKADVCYACHRTFGPALLRHHCRLCGHSYCHADSCRTRKLPQLGYHPDVPERVCDACAEIVFEHNLMERIAWRLARCRDYFETTEVDHVRSFTPYFEIGVDSVEQKAYRIAQAAITMAKSIPLGAQATVAVETADVLRKYGLSGIYTIMLRQEFLAAADLLRKALGINRTAWPLSVHELSAAIFYALAQHRAMRGIYPDREHLIHATREPSADQKFGDDSHCHSMSGITRSEKVDMLRRNINLNCSSEQQGHSASSSFEPVCQNVPSSVLSALIFHAPLALNFIYLEKEVDMQLLAAQQGWRMVYAYLKSERDGSFAGNMTSGVNRTRRNHHIHDRPASALFVHDEQRIVCIAIRGTSTIHDVITDIRQLPVPFPEASTKVLLSDNSLTNIDDEEVDDEWTAVTCSGKGVAVAGMACAAMNLFREHIDALLLFVQQGYRIRLVGHSLGGAVAALLGVLVHKKLKSTLAMSSTVTKFSTYDEQNALPLQVYAYGTPSCADASLSDIAEEFVVSVVLHDDVIPRLSPTTCRGLLKHLLHIRETWVKTQFPDDVKAFADRARTIWAPRWRDRFTLHNATTSSVHFKRYCRKQIQNGKKRLLSVTTKLAACDDKSAPSTLSDTTYSTTYRSFENGRRSYVDEGNASLYGNDDAAKNEEEVWQVQSSEDARASCSNGSNQRLVMDFMGGLDAQTAAEGGMVVDGDEFFDPDALLDESNMSEEDGYTPGEQIAEQRLFINDETARLLEAENKRVSTSNDVVDESGVDMYSSMTAGAPNERVECEDNDESPEVVVLDEVPLPKMFVPGRIIHLYSHRGVYKAAFVPKTFREIRRISMAGNMLSDHKAKAYYDALLEVRSVRRALESPSPWTAFDEDDKCSCCASRFTWASTSDSEAQEARDKHNCRSCGALVCHPCSENRVPLPSIGLLVSVRVCDRCYYNDLDASTGSNDPSDTQKKSIRTRAKRSAVVDDLASRVQASPFPL